MRDIIKKLLSKMKSGIFWVVVIAIVLLYVLLLLSSFSKYGYDFLMAIGGGSLFTGILTTPFFLFGIVQIIRGAFSTFSKDTKRLEEKYGNTNKGYIIFIVNSILTLLGYYTVIEVIILSRK